MEEFLKPGIIVKGTVSGIEKYGIFVNLENGYNGMIHISEISEKFVHDINSYATLGSQITCKVLEVDNQKKQTKLSIKSLKKSEIKKINFSELKRMLPIWIKEKMEEIKD